MAHYHKHDYGLTFSSPQSAISHFSTRPNPFGTIFSRITDVSKQWQYLPYTMCQNSSFGSVLLHATARGDDDSHLSFYLIGKKDQTEEDEEEELCLRFEKKLRVAMLHVLWFESTGEYLVLLQHHQPVQEVATARSLITLLLLIMEMELYML